MKNTLRRLWPAAFAAAVGALLAPPASAEPPRITHATPDHADTISPTLTELRFTFDQDMSTSGQSICGGGPSFPQITAPGRWDGPRTFVLPVKLEPGKSYSLSINCPAARNFRSSRGEPAEPHPIQFRTLADGESPKTLEPAQAAAMTATLRRLIDERYSYRDLRGIDWDARFTEFRPRLEGAPTPAAFARAAAELLRINSDLHTTVEVDGLTLATGRRSVSPNADPKSLAKAIPHWRGIRNGAAGRFDDGTGYIAIHTWSGDDAAIAEILAAIDDLTSGDTPAAGMIIDVRLNSGGNEALARKVASRFVEERTVYSRSRIRDPQQPDGWAGPFDRSVSPAPDAKRFGGKVAVLMGPACMSSCESFLLMMQKDGKRELFGAPSWGSSGNPRPHDVGHGVRVFLSSWEDLFPNGGRLEGVGIAPDHAIEWRPGPKDPVLDAALAWLRGP